MTITDVTPGVAGEFRVVALSALSLREGFNPRTSRDSEKFAQTVRSVRGAGVLQPILVTRNGAPDAYVVVAGEGRYLAAGEVGQVQVPVIVVQVDERTGGLELAMAENLAREDLDLVAQARGFAGLKDAGWSKKGIADYFGVSQRLVTERLQILELPDTLYPQVASGDIPPSAIKPLVALTKIHPGLPGVITARVLAGEPAQPWAEPLTWPQVVEDAIGALTSDYRGQDVELPSDVYDASERYPVGRFSLSEKAEKDLAALVKLTGIEAEEVVVGFGREALEQALALKAVHPTQTGWNHIIVGQDVADQLVGDQIASLLKRARAEQRHRRELDKTTGSTEHDGESRAPSEEELREQRRTERAEREERQRAARAYNAELGAAVFKHLARLKVDERVLKVLIAVDTVADLGDLAMRGARYGLPGWVKEEAQKNGKVKVTVLEKTEARAKAREFLDGGRSLSEIAGRVFSLVAMARYADEDAVARTRQSMTSLHVGDDAPWSEEVLDLIDDVCAERLPDHLTAAVRERRTEARRVAEQERAERHEALGRLEGLADRVAQLDEAGREQAIADAEIAYGPYSRETWDVRQLIKQATDPTPVDTAAQDDAAPANATTEPTGVEADEEPVIEQAA